MNTYPDKENTLSLLGDWQKHYTAVSRLMDGVEATIGIDQHGPMHKTVWRLFEAYTSTLAIEIGDYFEWLDWYESETDMGKLSHKCIVNGKTKRVKTLAQLCAVIMDERNRIPP